MRPDGLGDWRRSHYASQISPEIEGMVITALGWAEDIRDLGGIKFISLRDMTGTVQVTIPRSKSEPSTLEQVDAIKTQSVLAVRGRVKRMAKAPRGVEITPEEIRILAFASHPLPLDPTGRIPADLDVRLDARILDLRRPEPQAVFRIRNQIARTIRDFFFKNGHVEVHTPKIIASATEGGAELFPIAYFDREAFLAQSPQLYKEQLSSAFEKVFEIAPIFRAEESHTTRHLSESISVDMEEAFVDYNDVMQKLESMICETVNSIMENCSAELETLGYVLELPQRPFRRYTYTQILEDLRGSGMDIKWGSDISTELLRTLGDIHKGFYFIKNWPTASKPFYVKQCESDPHVCESFDLMHSWLELASGGTRVSDTETLVSRLKAQGLNPNSFEYHLKVYDYGMPPHSGFGLGLERLVMVLTGVGNIREVSLYPRDRFRLRP